MHSTDDAKGKSGLTPHRGDRVEFEAGPMFSRPNVPASKAAAQKSGENSLSIYDSIGFCYNGLDND